MEKHQVELEKFRSKMRKPLISNHNLLIQYFYIVVQVSLEVTENERIKYRKFNKIHENRNKRKRIDLFGDDQEFLMVKFGRKIVAVISHSKYQKEIEYI